MGSGGSDLELVESRVTTGHQSAYHTCNSTLALLLISIIDMNTGRNNWSCDHGTAHSFDSNVARRSINP